MRPQEREGAEPARADVLQARADFDRAAEVYELLVRENPADPTLRVNLGLVYLKTNQLTARGEGVRDRDRPRSPSTRRRTTTSGWRWRRRASTDGRASTS